MQFPIFLELHRSCFLDLANALLHLLVAGVLLATPWLLPAQMLSLSLCLFSAGLCWKALKPPVQALKLGSDGDIAVRDGAGDAWREVLLLPGARIHPLLSVLRVRESEDGDSVRAPKVIPLILALDTCTPEGYRRFRVWARCLAQSEPAAH